MNSSVQYAKLIEVRLVWVR